MQTAPYRKSPIQVLDQVVNRSDGTLSIEDVLEGTIKLLSGLGSQSDVWDGMSVRTLRYYRQKGIIDEPLGRTVNARYAKRHILQAALARLSGHVRGLSLTDAAEVAKESSESLANRLAEIARDATRAINEPTAPEPARPLPGVVAVRRPVEQAIILDLGGGATLTVPVSHPALKLRNADDLRSRVLQMLTAGD